MKHTHILALEKELGLADRAATCLRCILGIQKKSQLWPIPQWILGSFIMIYAQKKRELKKSRLEMVIGGNAIPTHRIAKHYIVKHP